MTDIVPTIKFPDAAQPRLESLRVNLEDLRGQLTLRLVILVLAVAQLLVLFYESPVAFPLDMLLFWFAVSALGVSVLWLRVDHPAVARWALVWGATAVLLLAMWLFSMPWIPYTGLLLVFGNSLLVRNSEFGTAVAVGALAAYLSLNDLRPYDLAPVLCLLVLAAAIAVLAVRTLYTTLDWVWQMNEQSKSLLATTRSQQAELRSMVKSLRIVNDIRERTEYELMIAHKEAQQARQLKEQFAANISHELRTPLSIILGFSEVMYLSPEVYGPEGLPPPLMRDVYQIYRNSRHLLEMIDDILDLSRFEMVGFTLKKEPTDLAALMREAAAIVGNLFEKSDAVTLRVVVDEALPEVAIDQTRIRQVLLNLLNNAHRFTTSGSVTLTAVSEANHITVHVQDTGPGIPAEKLDDIFTEFYQVDYSLSRSHGGAGLGLAICQRFVEAHDGRIWVESVLGQGSVFSFTLPIDPLAEPAGHLYRTRPMEPPVRQIRPCLLLVEPDAQVRSLIARHLDNFAVIPLEDGESLAALAAVQHPLAVLVNVQPGQQADPTLTEGVTAPIIECSLPSQSWMATTLGARACLTKPIDFAHLLAEIDRIGGVHDVLVIDDNPGVCQLVERSLGARNGRFAVRIAYEGRSGLLAMRQSPPDLVILDLMMPEVDGFAVLETMQNTPELTAVSVILLTATSYIEETLAQYGHQVRIVQSTPWHPAETLHFLKAALAGLKPTPATESV
ncbi:MAG: response regulator [Chloroflexi bacterium]|nr:response regulator [Chloroflexota bacterium]MBP7043054.1 response regulator [Chloroflexota bacterium]